MKFRDATLQDLPVIVSIYNSTIPGRMVTADTVTKTVEDRLAWFHEHNKVRPLWIVEGDHQETIGWVSFQFFSDRPAYNGTAEISIYLDEKQRGKGYGRKILDYSMAKCSDLQIKTLLALIFSHNEPSMKLFYQAGFEEWAMLKNIAELDGIERSTAILAKRVN